MMPIAFALLLLAAAPDTDKAVTDSACVHGSKATSSASEPGLREPLEFQNLSDEELMEAALWAEAFWGSPNSTAPGASSASPGLAASSHQSDPNLSSTWRFPGQL
eukprot:6327156-Karenia_brevis.AAC.1